MTQDDDNNSKQERDEQLSDEFAGFYDKQNKKLGWLSITLLTIVCVIIFVFIVFKVYRATAHRRANDDYSAII